MYYEEDASKRRDRLMISPSEIIATIREPEHRLPQDNGRTSLFRYFLRHRHWLRVVVNSDGETVHNAYLDRRFRP
ncbi:MAG: hypothetical protein ACRYG4_07015 [Janthinobacterium lividum]